MLFPLVLHAQGESLSVGGMSLSYSLRNDSIDIVLSAPTTGWVGIGFNDRNSIVKSDLLLFHVVDGTTEAIDMYVVGAGNPKQDIELGGQYSIGLVKGEETGNKTTIQFSIPIKSEDRFDFQHEAGSDFWLIMAYSTHDEFAHHSRMRKHVKYRFRHN